MKQKPPQVSSIILCGGSARRLGGIEKPLLDIDGEPMVAVLAARLSHLGPILISANREQARYRQYGEVVADAAPDLGPLAGLHACLQRTNTAQVLVVPGDCPDYSLSVAQRLLSGLADQSTELACAHDGQQQQYLHLALERSALGALTRYLDTGGRSVKGWLDQMRVATVDCADLADAFADIDTQDDLNRRQSS